MSAVRALAAVVAAVGATGTFAQGETTVFSARAESVAITIYRDDLALVTETRGVELPAGPVTLVIDGVIETLLPQSAILSDAARPLAESNFDFDRLTPRSLLTRSIGETVTITRTNPATGRVTRTAATIVAVGEGVVLQTVDGAEALYCSGLPERLELMRVPDELLAKPRLSIKLASGTPGSRTVTVSYLAHGFAWSSDYVAHLNERSDALQLSGWATLSNSTGAVLEQAEVQLVAGRLNILAAEEGGSAAEPVIAQEGEAEVDTRARLIDEAARAEVALLRECFASDVPLPPQPERMAELMFRRMRVSAQADMVEEIQLTAVRIEREELGDYQLYRLPWRTDLAARQTKQVSFLDEPAVRVERFYGFRLTSLTEPPDEDIAIPDLTLRFENTEQRGLGEPLPSGTIRVFEAHDGRDVFAGEAIIGDSPVGLPVELVIGRAQGVMLEVTTDLGEDDRDEDRVVVTTEHRIVNNKGVPIDLEIRHGIEDYYTDAKVETASRRMRPKYGDFAWRFVVEPGEERLLYSLSALAP